MEEDDNGEEYPQNGFDNAIHVVQPPIPIEQLFLLPHQHPEVVNPMVNLPNEDAHMEVVEYVPFQIGVPQLPPAVENAVAGDDQVEEDEAEVYFIGPDNYQALPDEDQENIPPPQENAAGQNNVHNMEGGDTDDDIDIEAVLPTNGEHYSAERNHNLVPIYIVRRQQDVVPFIRENVSSGYLSQVHNTLINFNSHPDLLVPTLMPADDAFSDRLLPAIDHDTWIIPNCFTGLFDRVIWLRPPWSQQITTRRQKIYVGKCRRTQTIRLECNENYFIAENIFEFRRNLDEIKEFGLDCLILGNRMINYGDDIGELRSISEFNDKVPTVLNIDLDFFSTRNPYLELHPDVNLYERLRGIYRYTPPQSWNDIHIQRALERRCQQIQEIDELIGHLDSHNVLPPFTGAEPSPIYEQISLLVDALAANNPNGGVVWPDINVAGGSISNTELPHNISTQEELDILFQSLDNFLETFLEPPRMITISRSTQRYTPHHQVDYIQKRVLEILNKRFRCAEPYYKYLEDGSNSTESTDNATEHVSIGPLSINISDDISSLSSFSESPKSEGVNPYIVAQARARAPLPGHEEAGPSGYRRPSAPSIPPDQPGPSGLLRPSDQPGPSGQPRPSVQSKPLEQRRSSDQSESSSQSEPSETMQSSKKPDQAGPSTK